MRKPTDDRDEARPMQVASFFVAHKGESLWLSREIQEHATNGKCACPRGPARAMEEVKKHDAVKEKRS